MKYYRILDDINYPKRWYLGDVIEFEDNWQFIYGNKIDEKLLLNELHIEVFKDGSPMDYTTSEAFSVPIVSEKVKAQIDNIKGLQFVPVTIQGKEVDLKYFIMIVTNVLDCVDEKSSVFGKFVENDPIRPDLAGRYSWFTKLIVQPNKINDEEVFRINKTASYLIVSEKIKNALEYINSTGMKFIEV